MKIKDLPKEIRDLADERRLIKFTNVDHDYSLTTYFKWDIVSKEEALIWNRVYSGKFDSFYEFFNINDNSKMKLEDIKHADDFISKSRIYRAKLNGKKVEITIKYLE